MLNHITIKNIQSSLVKNNSTLFNVILSLNTYSFICIFT